MEAGKFVDALYASCVEQKIEEFQITYSYKSSFSLRAMDGAIDKRAYNENQGVSLAVKNGINIGSFECGDLSEKSIPLIISQALDNASLISNDEENFFHDGSGLYQEVRRSAPIKKLYDNLDKEKFVLELEKAAYAYDKRIKKVISAFLGEGSERLLMRNSYGLDLKDELFGAYAYLYVSAESDGVVKTGGEMVFFDKEEDFDPASLARKAAQKALDKLNAGSIKSGEKKVVFENKTFGDFLNVISGIFSANSVQEKRSKLVGLLGKKVAADMVTLVDNPLLEGGYASRSFDGEGYPGRINKVIENGVLKTYLHNLRTAHKDGVASTGNGSGSGERSISFSNFYIESGDISKEDVLAKAGEGVYITDLNGVHAGYSSVSGDFSFGADGFVINNGKIGKPLNQFTISGNVYTLLQNISALGNDLEFNSSAFGAPTVLVDGLSISND